MRSTWLRIAGRPYKSAPRWGHVAEWLRSGLQNRLHQFNSGRGLHSKLLKWLWKLIRGPFRDPSCYQIATICLPLLSCAETPPKASDIAYSWARARGCSAAMGRSAPRQFSPRRARRWTTIISRTRLQPACWSRITGRPTPHFGALVSTLRRPPISRSSAYSRRGDRRRSASPA